MTIFLLIVIAAILVAGFWPDFAVGLGGIILIGAGILLALAVAGIIIGAIVAVAVSFPQVAPFIYIAGGLTVFTAFNYEWRFRIFLAGLAGIAIWAAVDWPKHAEILYFVAPIFVLAATIWIEDRIQSRRKKRKEREAREVDEALKAANRAKYEAEWQGIHEVFAEDTFNDKPQWKAYANDTAGAKYLGTFDNPEDARDARKAYLAAHR
jgi:hypothetical protein